MFSFFGHGNFFLRKFLRFFGESMVQNQEIFPIKKAQNTKNIIALLNPLAFPNLVYIYHPSLSLLPFKTYSPLIVNADAILSLAIGCQPIFQWMYLMSLMWSNSFNTFLIFFTLHTVEICKTFHKLYVLYPIITCTLLRISSVNFKQKPA